MNNIRTSYLLWLGIFCFLGGLHRIYNKKIATGLLWFFTFGLFGIGQFIDVLLIPSMVDEHNLKVKRRLGLSPNGIPLENYKPQATQTFSPSQTQNNYSRSQPLSSQEIMVKLARVAQKRGGKLSVTQAVIDTGITFEEVEKTLNEMTKKGYVMINNHPDNGIVIYDFTELS